MNTEATQGALGSNDQLGQLPAKHDIVDRPRDCQSMAGTGLIEAADEIERLRAYANAAHWWAEAHDQELAEAGDTRDDARARMLDAEAALLAAGHVFDRA